MKNLSELIAELMTVKSGNKEFALEFYESQTEDCYPFEDGFEDEKSSWSAVIGNLSKCVSIAEAASYGEKEVEFYAISRSAEDAVQQLINKVKA